MAALTAAILVGVGIGAGLSYDRFRPSPQPAARQPVVVSTPTPPPVVPTPTVTVVDDEALDTAIQGAVRKIGRTLRSDSEPRSAQDGPDQVRWQRRTIEVRLSATTRGAMTLLRAAVERAGGQVFEDSPSGLQVGVFHNGVPLITHELRFVTAPAAARAVIIFDDAGGSLAELEPIVALGRPVTVAVLPGLRYSREVARRAQAAGLDVFLHLPVEPEDESKKMGPGGVTTAMSEDEIATMVRADLAWVPGAGGMNNHMGSRGTADPRVMRAILEVAKERGLIFVDSMTSPRSIGARMAAEMKVPTTIRDVFLDTENEPEVIRQQIQRLIAVAKRRGTAVGIGHTQRLTARVLLELLPEFDRQGVEIVPVASVVH